MINDDEQLSVVRQQLATAEAALESLRRKVLPQNPELYEVFAESYVEMVLSLRREIDAYLGIATASDDADLTISLEGERVVLGRTSAGMVTRFIDAFRRGLQAAVEIVEHVKRPGIGRRRERWIEHICDLPIVGIQPGSVKILLGEPESQSLFSRDEQETFARAIDLVFSALHWADLSTLNSPEHPFLQLDKDTRQSLLALITGLLPPRTGDVHRVAFKRRVSRSETMIVSAAVLTRPSRQRIRKELESLSAVTSFAEVEGVIREVDLDQQTFVLRELPGPTSEVHCEYGPELEEAVKEALDCRVIAAGILETSPKTQRSKLRVDTVEVLISNDEWIAKSVAPLDAT